MNYNQWNYCVCGWQTPGPNQGTKNECPECKKRLLFVAGSQKEIEDIAKQVKDGKNISEIVKI